MKYLILFLMILMIANSVLAVEPETFIKVLNIDAEKFSTQNDDFEKVKEVLGETKRFNHGDAAESKSWLEYLSQDRSQMITFSRGECFSGYSVQIAKPKNKNQKTIMKLKVNKIEVGGLYLGMSEQESLNIFSKMTLSDWRVKETRKEKTKRSYDYRKNISVNNQKYCHHITINLKFDKNGKLEKYDFISSECEDAGCLE